MRALVISGGGSKGAYAGGLAEYLIRERKRNYDILIGSSTGSLLVPLLSIGEIDKLKAIFTSVNESDIFNSSPFIIKQKNGEFFARINHFGILKMFLKGKKTFGESENLHKIIKNVITEADYRAIQRSGRQVMVTVSNLTTTSIEYKSVKDFGYDDYCDWIWASTSLVPFMSLVNKNGFDYADGGMGDFVPIFQAIQKGASEIDVILLKTDRNLTNSPSIHNAFDLILRIFNFMLTQIGANNLTIGELEGLNKKVKLNIYRPLKDLTANSLIFIPEQMKRWWDLGYHSGVKNAPESTNIEIPNQTKIEN
jgi:predicted patatin/cPLA2 family phospholipase